MGRPTMWGNPYKVGSLASKRVRGRLILYPMTAADAVAMYRKNYDWRWRTGPNLTRCAEELRGKNLACWCALVDADGVRVPCHADVLLEWANG